MPFDFVADVRGRGRRAGQFEGVTQDAVGSSAGEDGLLDHRLVLGAVVHAAADLGVFAFGVFAHDPDVDIARVRVAPAAE